MQELCPFLTFENSCIYLKNKQCSNYKNYLYCSQYQKNNPTNHKRINYILSRVSKKLKILNLEYMMIQYSQENEDKGSFIIIDTNIITSKNPIIQITDNYNKTAYEIIRDLYTQIQTKENYKYNNLYIYEKTRLLNPEEIIMQSYSESLETLLTKQIKIKKKISTKLLSISAKNKTAIIQEGIIFKVYKINYDINSFISNYSTKLLLTVGTLLYELKPEFKTMREVFLFIKYKLNFFKKNIDFVLDKDNLILNGYLFKKAGYSNKNNFVYLKAILELLDLKKNIENINSPLRISKGGNNE